jgi:hypothetical protein
MGLLPFLISANFYHNNAPNGAQDLNKKIKETKGPEGRHFGN